MFRSFALLLILVFAGGCTSMPAPISSSAVVDQSKGVLLAGLSSDEDNQVMDAWFFYRRVGTDEALRLDTFGMAGLIKKPNDYAPDGSRMGRLIALPLEPGEYELFNWMLYVYRAGGYGYVSPEVPPPAHGFTIRAGEITYLGGLHLEPVFGKNFFGFPMVFGGEPEITDQSVRDYAVLKVRYPNLTNWPIRPSVPDGALWKIP